MTSSPYTEHPFSPFVNAREQEYMDGDIGRYRGDEESAQDPDTRFRDNRLSVLPDLSKYVQFHGTILEVAAGCCWFSAELSKLPDVQHLYALDMSRRALQEVAPKVMKLLGANEDKMTRVLGDFNELHFDDAMFDLVVFDAALHHIATDRFAQVMQECRRVLKRDGKMIAIREPVLTSMPVLKQWKRRQYGAHEKKQGVTENTYTKREWETLFAASGLVARFHPSVIRTKASQRKSVARALKNAVKNVVPFVSPQEQYIILTAQ